jgi:hypothetical protein
VCSVLCPTHGGVVPTAAPRLSPPMQHRRLLAAIHFITAHQLLHRAVHPEAVIVLLQLLGRQLGIPEVGQHVLLLLGIVHRAAGGRPQLAQVGRIHLRRFLNVVFAISIPLISGTLTSESAQPKTAGSSHLDSSEKVGSWTVSCHTGSGECIPRRRKGFRRFSAPCITGSRSKMCWKVCSRYHNPSIATEEHMVLSLQKI